jgi:hypothetical protein
MMTLTALLQVGTVILLAVAFVFLVASLTMGGWTWRGWVSLGCGLCSLALLVGSVAL